MLGFEEIFQNESVMSCPVSFRRGISTAPAYSNRKFGAGWPMRVFKRGMLIRIGLRLTRCRVRAAVSTLGSIGPSFGRMTPPRGVTIRVSGRLAVVTPKVLFHAPALYSAAAV